jgi:hypothetical protein
MAARAARALDGTSQPHRRALRLPPAHGLSAGTCVRDLRLMSNFAGSARRLASSSTVDDRTRPRSIARARAPSKRSCSNSQASTRRRASWLHDVS